MRLRNSDEGGPREGPSSPDPITFAPQPRCVPLERAPPAPDRPRATLPPPIALVRARTAPEETERVAVRGRGVARGLSQMKVVLALLVGVAAAFVPAKPLVSAPVRSARATTTMAVEDYLGADVETAGLWDPWGLSENPDKLYRYRCVARAARGV